MPFESVVTVPMYVKHIEGTFSDLKSVIKMVSFRTMGGGTQTSSIKRSVDKGKVDKIVA